MVFKVVLTSRARADLNEAIDFIHLDSPDRAMDWSNALFEVLDSLTSMPNRNPLLAEKDNFELVFRELRYHSHRIVYHVNEQSSTVTILRVYHAARRSLGHGDLP